MEEINILPLTMYEFKIPEDIMSKIEAHVSEINWSEIPKRAGKEHFGRSTKGYQSWHNNEKYKYIVEFIEGCLNEVKNKNKLILLEKIKVSLMWVNRAEGNEWTHPHFHEWSVLSGILYIKGSKAKTWFSKDSDYKNILPYETTADHTNHHDLIHRHSPKVGTLLVFPSTLMHSVEEAQEAERITIAFNSFASGKCGEDEGTRYLNISVN